MVWSVRWSWDGMGVPGTMPLPIPQLPSLNGAEVYFQAWAAGASQSWRPSGRLDLVL